MFVISGKHFNRCKHIHPLATAFISLHFDMFLDKQAATVPIKLREVFSSINDDPSDEDLDNLFEDDSIVTFIKKYHEFCDKTRDGSYGNTARFWMLYMDLVHNFLLFSRAVRINDLKTYSCTA